MSAVTRMALLTLTLAGGPVFAIGPFDAAEAINEFQLHPDCRIELVAAEPDVVDPVHIAFDARGRLWVVEYSDYPNGPAAGEPGTSRIRILTDENGDGRYESPRLFADKLLFATGLLPWRDGVIVTLAGRVVFMRDTDGDDHVDETEEWFVGFKAENPQLRANHPTLAIDNHIYIASGLRGGEVAPGKDWAAAFGRDPDDKPEPVSLSGRDFRFDPLTGDFEAVSGPGQFGVTFDDWGTRFVCDNRHPCRQILFEDRHLKRNPKFAVPAVAIDVLPAGEQSRLFPISRTWTTSNLHANQFTAACGLCFYRGTALPTAMQSNVFVCDPTANLVHRAVTNPDGAVYDSNRGREGVEFLATQDEWFRPVNLTIGPDGSLYVVDMYRAVIEHPQFMPEELKARPDLLLGTDRGRIYRISGKKAVHQNNGEWPADLDAEQVARLLEHSNVWHREAAHARLLGDGVLPTKALREVLTHGSAPHARAHAAWLLYGRGLLDEQQLLDVLSDTDPNVRRQAVNIAAEMGSHSISLAHRITDVGQEADDGRTQFAVALALPEVFDESAAPALLELLYRAPVDPYLSQAVATAPPDVVVQVLLLRSGGDANSSAVARGREPAFAPLLEVAGANASTDQLGDILRGGWNAASIAHIAAGLRRRGQRFSSVLPKLPNYAAAPVKAWLKAARDTASDLQANSEARVKALAALAHAPWDDVAPVIERLVHSYDDPTVRASAVDLLTQFRSAEIGRLLVDQFGAMPPAVRAAAIRAMVSSPARLTLLLDEIEQGRIAPQLIDAATIRRITTTGDATLRARAKKLFASLTPEARQQVLAEYQSCLSLDADPSRGRAVFKERCSTCHRIGELGVNVAPDISDSRTKTREYLLTSILDPNRAIDNNYFAYTVVDLEGQVHTGVLATETATSITLKQPEGKTVTLPRDQIETMQSSGVSLMPEGLERNINPQQMADVISFIKNWRYLDGSVPEEVIR